MAFPNIYRALVYMTTYFIQAFIYLAAAVIAVPLAKRFGLGSVLGYLVAGVMIGPVMGLVGQEASTIQHFAEFGVVMAECLFCAAISGHRSYPYARLDSTLGVAGLKGW
jgi:CPA2 family monovalent cation:H+ antiporter-2